MVFFASRSMWKNSEKTDGQFGKEKNALKNSSARSIDVN